MSGSGERRWQLSREGLDRQTEASRLEDISLEELWGIFRDEPAVAGNAPDARCQIDPRDGALVLYNSKRAKRPHDNQAPPPGGGAAAAGNAAGAPAEGAPGEGAPAVPEKPCPVCEGKTTGIIDRAPLSEGETFINKNLFPILYPPEKVQGEWLGEPLYSDPTHHGRVAYGMHFLQWTSSFHDRDWQNMPLEDRCVVLQRLAVLERKLLFESEGRMPPSSQWQSQKETSGFVSVIKNYGAPVGGSLVHGHQQIGWSNIMPRSFYNDWCFFLRHHRPFSDYLLRENPDPLTVRDYGKAILKVPYFMKRPYNMVLLVEDTGKQYLCELDEDEIEALAEGIRDSIRAVLDIMPRIGREPAYNLVLHSGPGAGLYLEILPYTQETGGFEQLGLWVCQGNPRQAADQVKAFLDSSREEG